MQILGLIDWEAAGRGIAAFFCKFIYQLIAWMYDLFITIARVNILSSEDIAPIYQRITMILTIVMVFYITFEFVKYVVQPDTINDKEKGAGNMALKIIVVILLIAFVPKIFTMAYDLQGRIIDNQLFSKVILGKKEVDMSTYGRGFSADMFSVFYKVNEEACKGCDSEGVVNFNLNRLRDKGDLRYLTAGLNESVSMYNPATQKNEDTPIIDFDGLFAIVVGVVLIYILALYCIDVGTRYAQLIFLQIISPIAIMGYLTPKKDNMFSKWVKQCVTTYLNLFIRIAIIYFVLLICQVLGESYGNGKLFEGLGTISPSIQAFTYIALVMGLLVFANKAPKMLQELFPSSGAAGIGFGLGAKDRAIKETARVAGAAVGAAVGGAWGLGTGIKHGLRARNNAINKGQSKGKQAWSAVKGATLGGVGGLAAGTTRGIYHGSKKGNVIKNVATGVKNQTAANKRFGNKVEQGYGIGDQIGDAFRKSIGMASRIEVLEDKKKTIKNYQSIQETIKKSQSEMDSEAEKQVEKGKSKYSGEYAMAKKNLQNMEENQNFKQDVKKEIVATRGKEFAESAVYKSYCAQVDNDTTKTIEQKEFLKQNKLNNLIEEATKIECENRLTNARKELKNTLDKAKFDFITNGEYKGIDKDGNDIYSENARIETLRSELEKDIELYNKNAPKIEKYQVNDKIVLEAMKNGEKFDQLIKGQGEYKDVGINATISNNRNEIAEIDSEIENVKGQTAGTETSGGKK